MLRKTNLIQIKSDIYPIGILMAIVLKLSYQKTITLYVIAKEDTDIPD